MKVSYLQVTTAAIATAIVSGASLRAATDSTRMLEEGVSNHLSIVLDDGARKSCKLADDAPSCKLADALTIMLLLRHKI